MPTSFVIDAASKKSFSGRTLVLDTNVLLDAFHLPSEFYDLAKELSGLGCDLVTTKSIVIEFLGGTKDKTYLEKKKEFLEITFGKELGKTYLPLDRQEPNLDDLFEFSKQANKFSVGDFELFCTLKKYQKKVALISRNHKDFTTKLVTRISFINLLGRAEVHTYGVYTIAP